MVMFFFVLVVWKYQIYCSIIDHGNKTTREMAGQVKIRKYNINNWKLQVNKWKLPIWKWKMQVNKGSLNIARREMCFKRYSWKAKVYYSTMIEFIKNGFQRSLFGLTMSDVHIFPFIKAYFFRVLASSYELLVYLHL